ncbi:MAG: DNA polymerase I [Dehalococcoidia bacterium]|nr:DNA polymerase I [Dehalococcoidia bacterium]
MTLDNKTAQPLVKPQVLKAPPLLMLLDGHAIVHRSYHAFDGQGRVFTSKAGEIVTAVYGFANVLLKALKDVKPQYWAVAFDRPTPTFRHQKYTQYKAQRPPTPEDLRVQIMRCHDLVKAFGLPIYELDRYEGDDILGTLARQGEAQGMDVIIISGDKDTMQLINPHVKIRYQSGVQKLDLYDEQMVQEKFGGLKPRQIIDLKALTGDSSDNIMGVPGIGDVIGKRLVLKYGSIENALANLDDIKANIKPSKIAGLLAENKERILDNKELCTIDLNTPVTLDTELAKLGNYDRARVVELFRELEFNSMIPRLPQSLSELVADEPEQATDGSVDAAEEHAHDVEPPAEGAQQSMFAASGPMTMAPIERRPSKYTIVDTKEALDELAAVLSATSIFALDTETDSLDQMKAKIVGISISTEAGKAWYIPVGHKSGTQLDMATIQAKLGGFLTDKNIGKVAHNANYDLVILENAGLHVDGVKADTMIAAHLLNERDVHLKSLALGKLNYEMTTIDKLIGTGKKQKSMSDISIPLVSDYAAADADYTGQLWQYLEPQIHKMNQTKLFEEIEMPLVPVLVRMQISGITLDTAHLTALSKELQTQIDQLEAHAYDVMGHQFNMGSPQQLSQVLFEEMNLLDLFKEVEMPRPKKTQGGYSTDAQALEKLRDFLAKGARETKEFQILDTVLTWRHLTKLLSTYIDSLPLLVNPKTGRIHTTFNQTGAVTGRLSSTDPNLQNIPIRTEVGVKVRKAFTSRAPDWLLLSVDYSQIELRILAHICKDPELLGAFQRNEDVHSATASKVFNVPLEKVTGDQRRFAKVVNFGVLYGMSGFGLAQRSDLSRDEALPIIEAYFERFKGINKYLEDTKKKLRDLTYVETMNGRRRYIPEIKSANFAIRSSAERMAVNLPIQGTAAEIIKIAMIRLQDRMDDLKMKSQMLLQVHDELIFDVPENEIDQMEALCTEIMPSAMKLDVPLKVDMKHGKNWGEL